MRALLFEGPGRLRVTDLPEPEAGSGEVKLRVGGCGVCGSDVHGYTGESGRRTAGQVMGHEFAGEIAAIGPDVTGWTVGQRVAAYNIIGCGQCRFCRDGAEQCCPNREVLGVNTGTRGAFAEFIRVPARNLAPIADHVSYAAALLNEPLSVSYHALSHVPSSARSLVIVGGGTIGQCLVMVARAMGRDNVFLLEPIEEKRKLAEANGATALPPDLALLRERLPDGADASIEAVGVEATVRTALESLAPAGTLVLLGNLAKEVSIPLQHISSNEKRLVGTYGFCLREFQTIVGWINERRFDLAPMVTGTCGLEETPALFADLAAGRRHAVKYVVTP